ncbi:MAG: GxxExxY protein [Bacteroidia bacterium]|jgi:PD-(D/E)XK nuclease superfamily
MEVHKFLGNGFHEFIYQWALAYELFKAGLEFDREIEQDIFYQINIPHASKKIIQNSDKPPCKAQPIYNGSKQFAAVFRGNAYCIGTYLLAY